MSSQLKCEEELKKVINKQEAISVQNNYGNKGPVVTLTTMGYCIAH
jgi:hypothetical protein